jgi:hypothetical protein
MGSTFKVASIWGMRTSLHHVEATFEVDPTENVTALPPGEGDQDVSKHSPPLVGGVRGGGIAIHHVTLCVL